MAGAVLFVLYIPVETEEGAESVVSQNHDSISTSENDTDDTTTNQSDSIHKSNSGVSIGDSHSGNVSPAHSPALVRKGDNVSVSSELKTSNVVSATGDTTDTPAVCLHESNVTRTDGMDDMKVSMEGRCAINTFPEGVSPKKDGSGDAAEMMDDAEKGKEESEKGRDGSELKEELGVEGSLSEDGIVYTTECITLEQFLQHVLQHLKINTDVWIKTDNNNYWQVTFVVESDDCESILQRLTAAGFGRFADTSISLFPASLHFVNRQAGEVNTVEEVSKECGAEAEEKNEFLSSIKSRLTVAQVVEDVKSNAVLTFDYILLIILASSIATLGLAENSSVILMASMLVSPLMGPIMGGTFGAVIRNRDLWMLGIRNELIGLLLCLGSGFLFGLVVAGVNSGGAIWGSTPMWPTAEMQARGLTRSLWVGILIAVPSGAGVALSILGGNIGSLVGVAISASLLPPAVNAGMLWACSIVSAIHDVTTGVDVRNISTSGCQPLPDNTYTFVYSCSMPVEAAILGVVSLVLTLINIVCIFFMGIFILKLKEVAPHAVPKDTEVFWKKDIKVARDTYRTIKGGTMSDLASTARDIAQEWRETKRPESLQSPALNEHLSWHDIVDAIENDDSYKSVIRHLTTPKPYVLRQMSEEVTTRRDLSPKVFPHNSPLGPSPVTIEMDRLRHRSMGYSPLPTSPPPPAPPAGTEGLIFHFGQGPHAHLKRHRHERVRRGIERLHSCPSGIATASGQLKTRFQVTKVPEGSVKKSQQKQAPNKTRPERKLRFQPSQDVTTDSVTENSVV